MMVGMLEGPDLIIVLVIVMVMFGATKLPELARGLGQAKREFEDAVSTKDAPSEPTNLSASTSLATPTGSSAHAGTSGQVTTAVATSESVTLDRDEYERLRRLEHPTS